MKNKVLYFEKPYQIIINEEPIPSPGKDEVLICTQFSGISAGTEMLFYQGLVPCEMYIDEKLSGMQNVFSYPMKYGYSTVGKIVETGKNISKNLINKWVFVFHSHETFFLAKENDLIFIPENILPEDAVFLPNMETAVNFVLDGQPLLGEKVLVLGLGVVGLLTTAILKQFPLDMLITLDLYEKRREYSLEMGADYSFYPGIPETETRLLNLLKCKNHKFADLIFELTGNPQALNVAIDFTGFEGRIVVGSWYGKKDGIINFGGKFHRERIKIISSQVSTIASELQGRWNKQRRFETAWNMIGRIKPSRLITHRFDITKAENAYKLLEQKPGDAMQIIFTYEE